MGVDMFWRRVPITALDSMTPAEIGDLVPYWHDDRFAAERDAGLLVGVEDTHDLIHALLTLGAGDGPDAEAAALPVYGDPHREKELAPMIYLLHPEQVRAAAEFMAGAPLAEWMERHRAALAVEVAELGYRRPFDDEWAARVLADAEELAGLFRRAAAEQDAMVTEVSA
jgi:uncharacterized protein with von Willebrand factor type A (vWA) domain